MLQPLLIAIVAALASFAAAYAVRRNAVRLGLIQTPNARSSHSIPTPGGGGVGIVLGGTIATAVSTIATPWPTTILLLTALCVAGIGFYDDRQPIPAAYRLGAQIVLSALALWCVVPVTALVSQIGLPLPTLLVGVVTVVAMVYWINLFNFMDGIDGIAASQAIFMALAGIALADLHVDVLQTGSGLMLLGLAAATLGFLALNWPPAKIFMGDAGSTYLGFMLAMLALLTAAAGWLTLVQWAILGALFITDATVTLARRLLLRERVFEAHRRHAYQVLSRRWGGHLPVTLSFIGINVVWLLPAAGLAGLPGWGLPALLLAYVPLIGLALYSGAGAPEQPVTR